MNSRELCRRLFRLDRLRHATEIRNSDSAIDDETGWRIKSPPKAIKRPLRLRNSKKQRVQQIGLHQRAIVDLGKVHEPRHRLVKPPLQVGLFGKVFVARLVQLVERLFIRRRDAMEHRVTKLGCQFGVIHADDVLLTERADLDKRLAIGFRQVIDEPLERSLKLRVSLFLEIQRYGVRIHPPERLDDLIARRADEKVDRQLVRKEMRFQLIAQFLVCSSRTSFDGGAAIQCESIRVEVEDRLAALLAIDDLFRCLAAFDVGNLGKIDLRDRVPKHDRFYEKRPRDRRPNLVAPLIVLIDHDLVPLHRGAVVSDGIGSGCDLHTLQKRVSNARLMQGACATPQLRLFRRWSS